MEPRFLKRGNNALKRRACRRKEASMEPRFLKRGNFHMVNMEFIQLNRFNGTTLSQTWKSPCHLPPTRFKRVLQWNHAFSNVEMSRQRHTLPQNTLASMEPRFLKRGNGMPQGDVTDAHQASMEPRFLKRGNNYNP